MTPKTNRIRTMQLCKGLGTYLDRGEFRVDYRLGRWLPERYSALTNRQLPKRCHPLDTGFGTYSAVSSCVNEKDTVLAPTNIEEVSVRQMLSVIRS